MSVVNPSVRYSDRQTLSAQEKENVLVAIGAQPAVTGKGLSTNDYTDADKLKLGGITDGADPNVIEEITVNGTAVTPVNKSVALTIPSAITVDQTYNGSSTNPQSGIAVAQALSGTGQVPAVTSNDDGKVLKASYDSVTSQGSFRWDSAPSGVPSTTSADEGKVLGVTNSTGTLGWVSQTPAAHDSTVTVKTGDSTPVTLGSFTTDQASNSDITIPLAVPTGTGEKSGLMSAADKAKLDGLTTFSTSDNGLVPKPTSQEVTDGKYLKSDGSWGVPTDTTYSTFDTATDGLVPKANGTGATGKFLKGDGTWDIPTDTTYNVFTTSADGLVPASDGTGETGKFLKGDGSWATPTDTTYNVFTTSVDGLVPASDGAGDTDKFLKGDGTWATPTDTTYSGGDGIDITSNTVTVDLADKSGLEISSGKLQVKCGANLSIDQTSGALVAAGGGSGTLTGVKLEGASSALTPVSGEVTIPNASAASGSETNGLLTSNDKAKLNSYPSMPGSSASKFLKDDGTWDIPTGTTYSGGDGIDITSNTVKVDIASSGSGLEFSSNKLKVNGNASQAIEVGSSGVGIKLATGSGLEFSSGLKVKTDGSTIQVNSSGALVATGGGTTYTAGDGIDIASSTIKANIDTAAGLKFDSSSPKKIQINTGTNIGFNSTTGALDVPTVSASSGGTGGTNGVMLATDKEKLDSATVAVQLEGDLAPLTPSSGVATIPNAIPTGTTGATNGLITADDQAKLDQAIVYKENPYDQSSPKELVAQQMFVVESDQQIIDIVTNHSSLINGKGTLFFRITGI